ncbi:MAG TPA: MMPL family transporter [Solirubrobacterales bacterium]|nr:MMPL family transporter [Solirubrobacterales bacterium]
MRRSRGKGRAGAARGRTGERGSALLRHPRRVLAAAVLALVVLGVVGIGVEGKLSPTSLEIPGTSSARANRMLREHFGDSAPFVILLRGPAKALDRQGPSLVRALRRDPSVTTLSPWDTGSVRRLRPTPRRAIVIADFHVGIDEAVNETVPELNRILESTIHLPVRSTQTGYATLSRAIQDDSIAATQRGELIALPILLIVLLLVFRSPVAAVVPLAFGAVTVIASRGLLAIATEWFDVDAFALVVCTMMGLALGVDYALLMVSRFREELAGGMSPAEAARTTRYTAGRTTVFAGSTLMLSMLVAFFIVPGSLLGSLAATLLLVVGLSVLVAVVAGPAVLTLLGPNIDRWRIGPAPGEGRSRLMILVGAALRRPMPVAVAIGAVVLILAAPAIGLKTGPPSQTQLSHDDPIRKDFELIERAIGPGYDAPFVVVASAEHGTVTEPRRLEALSRWQRRIAAQPGVQAVIGPGQISRAVEPLRRSGALLATDGDTGPLGQFGRLGRNLGRAAVGVAQLREGVSKASYGAGLLAQGSGTAEQGATALAAGLSLAGNGSERAVNALQTFAKGTRLLAGAQHKAAIAGLNVKFALQSLGPNLRHNALRRSRNLRRSLEEESKQTLPRLRPPAEDAEAQLRTALAQLEGMTTGKTDPNFAAALAAVQRALAAVSGTDPASGAAYAPDYAGLPTELGALEARLVEDAEEAQQVTSWLASGLALIKRLSNGATRLSDGLQKLQGGGKKLAHGSARLARAASGLQGGVARLAAGATALAGGLARLRDGAATLEEKLAEGYNASYPLQAGLRRASVQVLSSSASLKRRAGRLQRSTPGLFNSGYFVLSALDGAQPRVRERAAEAVDLDGGGQAAAILVISRYTFNSPGSRALDKRLEVEAAELGREANLQTGVAGGPAQLNDYSDVTRARFPLVVVAITIATFLVLILVLRALPLAAIAVGLNLATVGVAFGILTLLFNLPDDWPLGGNTYVDAVGATAIFGVVFGLSIDYAVFLLVRMREHYDRTGDNAAAIEFGLARTARVITGAAAIMMAVFVAFAGASIATVSQLGIGLTVAVLLDATVVRIVLLPALMLLLGDRVWWLPRWLDRTLPRFNV